MSEKFDNFEKGKLFQVPLTRAFAQLNSVCLPGLLQRDSGSRHFCGGRQKLEGAAQGVRVVGNAWPF